MASLLENLLLCSTANGFNSKGIVMDFYKVVLSPTEGPVLNSTKDIALLIDKKMVISIPYLKFVMRSLYLPD